MAISSKKQWTQVAEAIAQAKNGMYWQRDSASFDKLIDILCEIYLADNPAFNVHQFRLMCKGINGGNNAKR